MFVKVNTYLRIFVKYFYKFYEYYFILYSCIRKGIQLRILFFRHIYCKKGLCIILIYQTLNFFIFSCKFFVFIYFYYNITHSFLHVHTHCLYDKTCLSKAKTNSQSACNLIQSAPFYVIVQYTSLLPIIRQTPFTESNA